MNEKHYEFKILDAYEYAWHSGEGILARDYNSFDEALADFGKNGWNIVSTNFLERKDHKLYMVATMQREIK